MTLEKLYNGGDKPILFRDERTKARFQNDADSSRDHKIDAISYIDFGDEC